MKKYNAIAACCVLSAIVSAAAVQAELLNVNLLTNGSFEDSPLGTNVNPVTGWSLTGTNGLIDGVNDSGSVVESWGVIPEDGDRQFRFQGTSNLFIEQTITLDGGDYSLSAWFAGRNNAPSNYLPTSSVVFELRNSGGTVITPVESSSPSIPENSTGGTTGSWVNWTREYTGIAAGDYSVRVTKDTSAVFAQGWVDNVSLTAVPEPSLALLGGFGLLAMLRRRKQGCCRAGS